MWAKALPVLALNPFLSLSLTLSSNNLSLFVPLSFLFARPNRNKVRSPLPISHQAFDLFPSHCFVLSLALTQPPVSSIFLPASILEHLG